MTSKHTNGANGHANGHGDGRWPPEYYESFDRMLHPDDAAKFREETGPGAVEDEEIFEQPKRPGKGPAQDKGPELSLLDPTAWQDKPVPDRFWCAPGLVPAGTVSLLGGPGGSGKSTIAKQLIVARAVKKPWLGKYVPPGRSLYLSAEDDSDELQRRTDAIARHYRVALADLGDIRFLDLVGEDAVLGAVDNRTNKVTPTLLYEALCRQVAEFGPDLIVLDSLADIFAGNENDRGNAKQFVGLLKKLCREFSLTVIILAHPSLSGMNSGDGTSGSTAWSNSVRSRLYFEADKPDKSNYDPDLRTLTTKKSNYGPTGDTIVVRYSNGVFVAQEGSSSLDRNARRAKADRVFLELLRLFTETGQKVSANRSPSYAPTQFCKHPDADGITKDMFADAMQRHLKAGCIKSEDVGSPSRPTTRLVFVEGGRRDE